MSTSPAPASSLSGIGTMLVSAALFGFFGFFVIQPVSGAEFFVLLFAWTVRLTAVCYVVTAGLTAVRPLVGHLLYSLIGLISAVLLIVVSLMDFANTQVQIFSYSEIIVLLFAAWNGFGSWQGLQALMMLRRSAGTAGTGMS